MQIQLEGRARRFGDDINTDYIIQSTRKRDSLDPQVLKQYLLETIDPSFAGSVQPGDLLVAGRNFGCGSAMEVAATVVVGAGIKAVLAMSFARTYYRNAINNGLVPVECDTGDIHEGNQLSVLLTDQEVAVENRATGRRIAGRRLPEIVLQILAHGGLVPYFRRYKDFAF
jgi:3-isopropylmalate/(R)-2-methylmalate dehydratase small subunit